MVALPAVVTFALTATFTPPDTPGVGRRASGPPTTCVTTTPVSLTPRTVVPEWIYADRNFIDGGAVIAGHLSKGTFEVAFDSGTTSARRTEIVRGVGGIVVGALRLVDDDPIYYVYVCSARTPAAMLAVREVLDSASGVAMAIPVMKDMVSPDRRP
jgi:hypothetical protein